MNQNLPPDAPARPHDEDDSSQGHGNDARVDTANPYYANQ